MERTETFYMPLYKCKCCGEIFSEPQIKDVKIVYEQYQYHTRWYLCEMCIEKGVNTPSITHFTKRLQNKNMILFLRELIDLILKYKVNQGDCFFKEIEK